MTRLLSAVLAFLLTFSISVRANGDDFGAVVKSIEQFYRVKHQSIPFIARAGIKAGTTVARLSGGDRRRLAEAGSVRIAFFENQEFSGGGGPQTFRKILNDKLVVNWTPLTQVLSVKEEEQTYIFLRSVGEKFAVMVIAIEKHDATVVQVTVSPHTLAELLREPGEMGQAIIDDANNENQE